MDEKQLRKEIDEKVADLNKQLQEGIKLPLAGPILDGTVLVAKIAALADIIARRHERISKRLVGLTLVLAVLTFSLLVFTITLYKDAHAQIQREQLQQNHQSK